MRRVQCRDEKGNTESLVRLVYKRVDRSRIVAGTLVATIVTAIAPHHLHAVWRIVLGVGVIPPLSLLYLRIKLKEPDAFSREKFAKKTPYWYVTSPHILSAVLDEC